MKKLISALAVVCALVASYSCQREVDYITDPAQAVTVTYSVSLDQVQKTKSTLAELDVLAVDKLFYSVYQSNGTAFNAIAHSDYHGSVALTGNTAELQFKLIQGETYKLVFWAQKGDSYITSAVTKDSPLGEISIDYTACDSYAADRDAFTAWDEITLDPVTQGADFATSFSKEIHLKRPFAQINFGTDDAAQAAAQGYVASKVQVIVKQAATKFNALTGVASEPVDASFKEVALPETPVEFDINNATYTRVAKAYVLPVGTFTVTQDGTSAAISSPLSTTPEVSMILSVKKGENVLALDPRSRANTSIRSNYRTNLLGHLITTDATFNVVVDNDYDGSTDHISIVSLGNATGSGAITMGEDETVSSNINFGDHPVTLDATMTIEGNVTISSNESNSAATITVNAPIVVTTGSTLTLEGVTIDPASTNATITIQPGATVIVNGGTYTADGDHDLFDLLTNSNPNPAPAQPGMHFAHGADGDQLIIRGGVFTGFDPSDYVDPVHYTVTEAPTGTWTVALKPVTLTLAEGALNLISGGEAVQKAISVDPTDTDLAALEIVNTNSAVASAAFDTNKENVVITPLTAGSTNISIKLGDSVSNIIAVSVTDASTVSVDPTAITVYPGNDSDDITITVNNSQTISSVVSANTDVVTVVWTSGASTFKVHGVAANADPVIVTVTTSANLTATVAVTVSTAPQLATPVPSAASADIADDCFIVKWAPVANATSYAVKYKLASATDFTEVAAANIDATKNPIEATIEGLAPAQTYVVKVQALDGTNYSPSEEASINVSTLKGDVTIEVASANATYSIVKGLTATISGVTVKYGNNAIDVPVTYTLGTDATGKISIDGTTITAVEVVDLAGINVVFAGNETYNANTKSDAIYVEVTAPVLTGITLNTAAVKKEFIIGVDQFTSSNLEVTASYNNNTSKTVTPTSVTPEEGALASAGTKTVTVSYTEGSVTKTATYEITVSEPAAPQKIDQAITLQYANTTVNKTIVDEPFSVTVESILNNAVLSSKNTSVATVSGNTVTIVGIGDAVIAANAAGNEQYNDAPEVSFTLHVTKAAGAISIADNATVAVSATTDVTYTGATGAVTASSSDTDKATVTVDTENSKIVITGVAAGTATVTVNVAESTNYGATSATIAVTVEAASLPAIQDVTVAQFNAAEPSETQRYRLTGIISNVTSTKYGNFDITDDTGTVYVYGLYPEEVEYGTSNPGESYFNTLSVAAGDQITIVGYRGVFNDKIEVMYAFHEAHVNALAAPENLVVGKTDDKKITASWDAVTGATSYTVKIGDTEFANATSPFTTASAYDDGTYSVSVKAVGGSTAPDSPYCDAASVTIGEVQLANPAVFVLNDMSIDSGTAIEEMTVAPITLTPGKGDNSNAPKYYTDNNNGNAVRCYGSNTLTLSSEKYITSVTFTTTAGGSNTLSSSVGTMDGLTWTGSAKNVVFTVSGTTGQIRIASISASWSEEAAQSYTITCAENLTGGTIEANKATAMSGETVTLTATPAEHYLFGSWSVNGGAVTVTNNQFTMPAENVTISATFNAAAQYGITIASGIEHGTIAVAGGATQAYEGDEVEITVTPDSGYKLKSLTYQQGSNAAVTITKNSSDKYVFNMPGGAVTVDAEFEEEGNGGTIEFDLGSETTGSNATSYVTTATTFTVGGVTFATNNWNPSTGQVRGNQGNATSISTSNFQLYNTTAIPGNITSITFEIENVIATYTFADFGSSALTSVTTSGANPTAGTGSVSWTVSGSNTYFFIGMAKGGTSGTAKVKKVTITYN